MRSTILLFFVVTLSVFSISIHAEKAPSSRDLAPESLRAWVDARAGTGETVHWIGEGSIFAYPSGKKLFGMIGFDSSKVIWPENPGEDVIHLTRKTFAYTDPATGKVLTEYEGQPVEPIAFTYQLITYRMEGSQIYADVEQGVAPGIQKIKSETAWECACWAMIRWSLTPWSSWTSPCQTTNSIKLGKTTTFFSTRMIQ